MSGGGARIPRCLQRSGGDADRGARRARGPRVARVAGDRRSLRPGARHHDAPGSDGCRSDAPNGRGAARAPPVRSPRRGRPRDRQRRRSRGGAPGRSNPPCWRCSRGSGPRTSTRGLRRITDFFPPHTRNQARGDARGDAQGRRLTAPRSPTPPGTAGCRSADVRRTTGRVRDMIVHPTRPSPSMAIAEGAHTACHLRPGACLDYRGGPHEGPTAKSFDRRTSCRAP